MKSRWPDGCSDYHRMKGGTLRSCLLYRPPIEPKTMARRGAPRVPLYLKDFDSDMGSYGTPLGVPGVTMLSGMGGVGPPFNVRWSVLSVWKTSSPRRPMGKGGSPRPKSASTDGLMKSRRASLSGSQQRVEPSTMWSPRHPFLPSISTRRCASAELVRISPCGVSRCTHRCT